MGIEGNPEDRTALGDEKPDLEREISQPAVYAVDGVPTGQGAGGYAAGDDTAGAS